MLTQLKKSFTKEIKEIKDLKALEQIRIKYLGRKGELTRILRSLKDLPVEKRREIGPLAQKLKREFETILTEKLKDLKTSAEGEKNSAGIDITKPGEKIRLGHLHPLTKIEEEIRQIFLSMNFSAVEGPEVETEHYNFDALNIPPEHPARDM